MKTPVKPRLAAALTLVFAVSATACAHVGQEEFDSEISSLRAELQDRGVGIESRNSSQIAALSARLDRLTNGLEDLSRRVRRDRPALGDGHSLRRSGLL